MRAFRRRPGCCFARLSLLDDVRVEGLMQSGDRLLARGLPPNGKGWFGPLSTDSAIESPWARRDLARGTQTSQETQLVASREVHRPHGRDGSVASSRRQYQTARAFRCASTSGTIFGAASLRARSRPRTSISSPAPGLGSRGSLGARCTSVRWSPGTSVLPFIARLDTSDFDIMIAETPYPATVSRRTTLIVRYHDAIPVLMPHTISDRGHHQASHYRALRKQREIGRLVCLRLRCHAPRSAVDFSAGGAALADDSQHGFA